MTDSGHHKVLNRAHFPWWEKCEDNVLLSSVWMTGHQPFSNSSLTVCAGPVANHMHDETQTPPGDKNTGMCMLVGISKPTSSCGRMFNEGVLAASLCVIAAFLMPLARKTLQCFQTLTLCMCHPLTTCGLTLLAPLVSSGPLDPVQFPDRRRAFSVLGGEVDVPRRQPAHPLLRLQPGRRHLKDEQRERVLAGFAVLQQPKPVSVRYVR